MEIWSVSPAVLPLAIPLRNIEFESVTISLTSSGPLQPILPACPPSSWPL